MEIKKTTFDESSFTRNKLLDKYAEVIEEVKKLKNGEQLEIGISNKTEGMKMNQSIRDSLKKEGIEIRTAVKEGTAYIARK